MYISICIVEAWQYKWPLECIYKYIINYNEYCYVAEILHLHDLVEQQIWNIGNKLEIKTSNILFIKCESSDKWHMEMVSVKLSAVYIVPRLLNDILISPSSL